jgi:alkyl hydroperoxide reductase subunit AhpC
MAAKVGQMAPYWEARGIDGDGTVRDFKASDYAGRWVVLFFYPLDFTFVCPTEIQAYDQLRARLDALGATVLGCSTDSVYSHRAWRDADLGAVGYALLADTSHDLSRKFGVLVEDQGIALRGTFIVDPHGMLRYTVVHDLAIGRSVEETVRVLEALQTGQKCPAGWKPGEATLGA